VPFALVFTLIPLSAHVDAGEGTHQSKYFQEPHHHENDHDSIQDRLDGSCHGDETINQPEQNTHYDQNHEYVNQRRGLLSSLFSEADGEDRLPEN